MICIPTDQGLTGTVFSKAKTVYYNNFDVTPSTKFQTEIDNIKGIHNIKNFVFSPIIGHDLRPNGVL